MRTCQSCNPFGRVSHKKLYEVWTNIKQRTRNPNNKGYADYGGRGIDICDLWHDSFGDFVLDVSTLPRNGKTLDRIDNSKGYELGNVRWADHKTQGRNRRSTRLLTHNGVTQCVSAWAEQTGLSDQTIGARLRVLGWTVERALTTKAQLRGR